MFDLVSNRRLLVYFSANSECILLFFFQSTKKSYRSGKSLLLFQNEPQMLCFVIVMNET